RPIIPSAEGIAAALMVARRRAPPQWGRPRKWSRLSTGAGLSGLFGGSLPPNVARSRPWEAQDAPIAAGRRTAVSILSTTAPSPLDPARTVLSQTRAAASASGRVGRGDGTRALDAASNPR